MARLDPAIRHAITPPEFGENMLHREHLVDRLHGALPNKLVAIAAPPGYGKSTLLADFVASTEWPVCWVRLTEADRDVMRLASVVLASLERRFRRLQNQLDLRAHRSESPQSLAAAFHSLVESNVPESFVVIFDDVHLVHSSNETLEFLDELVVEAPEQLTVIAAGREVPEISLARLMAEGKLAGMGPHDLAFRFEEVEAVLALVEGNQVAEIEVSNIYERTRGWPAGVTLSNQSSTASTLVGEVPESAIYEYLGSVALNRQPEHIRRFMIEASVLPVMSADILDHVLSRADSAEMLKEVQSRGLFITVTSDSETTYEFHPMFRELLQATLDASEPSSFIDLQAAAAEYLTDISPETAANLYHDAGDEEAAARVIDGIAERYFSEGRFATLLKWLDWYELPAEQAPVLAYFCGKILSSRGDPQRAHQLLGDVVRSEFAKPSTCLEAAISQGMIALRNGWNDQAKSIMSDVERAIDSSVTSHTMAMAYRLQARFSMIVDRDYERAVHLIQKAIESLEGRDEHYELIDSIQEKAQILGLAGKIIPARQAVYEALELSRKTGSALAIARALNNVGQLNYLSGNYEESLSNYEEALRLANGASSQTTGAWILLGQGDVFCDLGLTRQAADLYGRLLEVAVSIENPRLIRLGCIRTSALHRRGGSFRTAREWLRRAEDVETEFEYTSLQIQEAALTTQVDPAGTYERLQEIAGKTEPLEPDEEVFSHLLLTAASFYAGNDNVSEHLTETLEAASLTGGEQYMAAELRCMSQLREWIEATAGDHPVYSTVSSRLETMRAVARHYKGVEDVDDDPTELRLSALSGGTIEREGQIVEGLKPQARELLFFLVDSGSAERDRLAEEFWSDFPPGRQAANLHMAVYSLRRKLGKDLILLDGTVYRINPNADIGYDVSGFERTAEVALRLPPGDPRKLFALGESVRSYRGPFLPEFFSDWAEGRRRILEQKYLDVVTEYADEAIRRDQPGKAVAELREALMADPLRDDLNGLYIEALGMMSRRSELVAHFERYSSLLDREMGLEPSSEIKELYAKFLAPS